MRKKVDHPEDGRSIKTVLIYAAAVLIFIAISLTWKALLIIQQSKYSDEHFILAVAQKNNVREIIVFNPADSSMSVLKITDAAIPLATLPKQTAISTDGQLNVDDDATDVIKDDVSQTLFSLALRYPTLKKDITIFDVLRLALYAKNLPPNKQIIKEVSSSQLTDDPVLEKTLVAFLSDDIVATENTSIQIINASGVSGIEQRLERVLTHQGASVVSVTTAQKNEMRSQIKYFGKETYTLQKIKKLLGYESSTIENETISEITIIIGEDSKNTNVF